MPPVPASCRHLVVVLGDQLDAHAQALKDFDPAQDVIWMAEVPEESTHVWSAKQRVAVFLAAMRHFAALLRAQGWPVHYTTLDDPANQGTLAAELHHAIVRLQAQAVVVTRPGDWRVWQALQAVTSQAGVPLVMHEDTHFYATVDDFAKHARRRGSLRLEYFYREMRQKHGILMETDAPTQPLGGQWNFDADNRETFGKAGPGFLPPRSTFVPDATTQAVLDLVNDRFASHPGSLDSFAWPVTRAQALQALHDFIQERLPLFGHYQDAMWPGEVWLYHSHLSAALNLKLLNPREVVDAAVAAHAKGRAPLASVEGFVRQILGWREYVRGIYWTRMPAYADSNALQADTDLPDWYWHGNTDMACLKDAIELTLANGYAHHIQRLMVTGLYAMLLGVKPQQVHAWYLAVYVDAVEWVELPNTLGMSQYADGGLMASKPYAATGKYIQRMGGPCAQCRFDPAERVGPRACPFTTLYWDFLIRHEQRLRGNNRMAMQVKNLDRLTEEQRHTIAAQAQALRLPHQKEPS